MSKFAINLGDVFKADWTKDSIRVIAFDRHVVMYDTWWPHRSSWGMSKLLSKYTYYRLHKDYFEANATLLRSETLSKQEMQVHRPDLPFSFAARQELSWYDEWPSDMSLENEQTLAAQAIYIEAFGPKGSSKPPVLLHAANGQSFTETELVVRSKSIQYPHIRQLPLTNGVGIHRSGIQKGLPVYYLWGAKSRLDT